MLWFPFFTANFLGATVGLSCLERSLYSLMLVLYYEVGPFPVDLTRTYRIIGCESDEQRRAVDNMLSTFFVLKKDGWYQPKAEEIKIIQAQKSQKQRDRVMKRWSMRSHNANTAVIPRQYLIEVEVEVDKNLKSKSKEKPSLSSFSAKNIDDMNAILEHLNQKTGKRFRDVPANLRLIAARLKQATVDQIKQVVDLKCKHWLYDPTMRDYLRPSTLFNATKFEQYLGEINGIQDAPMRKLRDEIPTRG